MRVIRSEDSVADNLSDFSDFPDFDESDPKSMGRWMRKMSSELGEDLGPEFNEIVDRLEAGESPEKIEESLAESESEEEEKKRVMEQELKQRLKWKKEMVQKI